MVHRLDRHVSGAVVMARTQEAAAKLAAAFRAPALSLSSAPNLEVPGPQKHSFLDLLSLICC